LNVLSYILGYGQFLVLDESLSVLLDVIWYCCIALCTVERNKWWWWWWRWCWTSEGLCMPFLHWLTV